MSAGEIGFTELKVLVKRHWPLILGLALLAGLATLFAAAFLFPETYSATARIMIHPVSGGELERRPVAVYRSLAVSESILELTTAKLVEDGVLEQEQFLTLGGNVETQLMAVESKSGQAESSLLALTGWSGSPDEAAAIANTWAEVFIEQSRQMLPNTSSESEAVLVEELAPVRVGLDELEDEFGLKLDEHRQREQQVSEEWDQRILRAREAGGQAVAAYQTETRTLMESRISGLVPEATGLSPAAGLAQEQDTAVRSRLLEIVAVRSQLAQTPRILALEKSLSDEALTELIADQRMAKYLDSTLTTQEINPLYDSLAVRVLELENELKRQAENLEWDLSSVLTELERIQLERAAGLAALLEQKSLQLRTLRRRRSRVLEDLAREQTVLTRDHGRKMAQLNNLESSISERINRHRISGLLEEVERVSMAVPAVPQRDAEPRELPMKTGLAAVLGGLLGLVIALFRSSSTA